MPPSNKKHKFNIIACDKKINNIISDNTISDNTISNNTISDNTISDNTISNNTIFNNTISDNTISDNTNIIQNEPINNFFGIIIEKPPSPINIILDETVNKKLKTNIDLNLNLDTQNIFINNKNIFETNNIIYSNIELKKKIELLSEHEVCEIFRIIKTNKEKYSTNTNGIFFNVSTLKQISIIEICNFLLFCENNNKILEKEEKQREIYRDLVSEN